jgi:arginyl-tRNA synthetase
MLPFWRYSVDPFEAIAGAILSAYPDLDREDINFTDPPNRDLGDLSVPLFPAAKKLKTAPPKIAAEAAEKVDFGGLVTEAKPTGPYLNLRLDRAAVGRAVVARILEERNRFGSNGSGQGKHLVLEHTSINPNASPHVGRARCAMIGDSIARLLRFEDFDLEVHYYVNDMGRQIGLLVLMADELENMTFDEVLDAYVAANDRAKADPEFAEAGYNLLVKMEEGDPETQAKFKQVTDLCLKGQLGVLERIGASYDYFDRESKYVKDARLDKVLEALEQRSAVFTDEEGRLVVDLAVLGHDRDEERFFVLKRGNGSSMYGYRDLAYTIDKHDRGADANIIVLGEDHKMYFQQIGMILEAAGYPAPEPIYYAYILLRDGKMSTRQGKVVLLSDFLDQATGLALDRVKEQCHDLSAEEQEAIAKSVAVAAIRFTVLRVNPNKNVTFDMETALSFNGDTGPYIQYSCARISSILRKYEGNLDAPLAESFPAESDAEWALLSKLAAWPATVDTCTRQRAVAPIAGYALDLARTFTTFYHDCPVLTADSPELIHARVKICQATRQTLANALELLGIDAPERM